MTGKPDLYTNITNQIIAAIEGGANGDQWVCPWHHSGSPVMRPTSAAGRRYSGINRLILWAIAERYQYSSGTWATFQQWKNHGGQVRKGEKGAHVVLWKRADTATNDQTDGEDANKGRVFARTFCVFNKDQVAGIDPEAIGEPFSPETTQAQALEYLKAFGVPINFGLYDAYYRPDIDQIFAPCPESFIDTGAMLATISHEVAHASGHHTRENRDSLLNYHKDQSAHALEELVAELGASYLMADLGLSYAPRSDHAQYIESWLVHLKNDPKAIFTAARLAQAAAERIHSTCQAGLGEGLAQAA